MVGSILKWIGGITAVISLVVGAASVQELYTGWRNRTQAIDELVTAARLQLATHDYEGGWLLLDEALKLDPASHSARRLQIPYAMAWLRNIRVPADQKFSHIVDRLLPALYRGAATPKKDWAADVYAHIGWANYLKYRDGNRLVDVELPYRRALELDPNNPFAHVHLGHWILYRRDTRRGLAESLADARRHFALAFNAGRERAYVADLALIALLEAPYEDAEGEALRMANEVRKSGHVVAAERLLRLSRLFRPIASSVENIAATRIAALTAYVPIRELTDLYVWTRDRPGDRSAPEMQEQEYIEGRLLEASGEATKALAIYTSIARAPETNPMWRERVVLPAMQRLQH